MLGNIQFLLLFAAAKVHLAIGILPPEVSLLRSKQSALQLSYMNFSVDPCDNFYEYACGNWSTVHPIPDDKEVWSTLTVTEEKELVKIRELIESRLNNVECGCAIQKAKDFYTSCTNTRRIEERGATPLLDFLQSLGGWPAIDDEWSEEGKDWLNLLAETRRLDQRLIFDSFVFASNFNPTQNNLQIWYPVMGLSSRHSFLEPGKELNAYKTLIQDVIYAFNNESGNIESEVHDIVDFETKLAEIVYDFKEISMAFTQNMQNKTLGILNERYTNIDWIRYFSLVHKQKFRETDQVLVQSEDFLEDLNNLIGRTSKKTLFNFLMWKIVNLLGDNIGDRCKRIFHKFKVEVGGVQAETDARERCLLSTKENFKNAVGCAYVVNYFDDTSRRDAKDLTSRLKVEFKHLIEQATWMDERTKEAAIEKLKVITGDIGYPDFVRDSEKLDDYYSTVSIYKSNYFENLLSVYRFKNHEQTVTIGKPADKSLWLRSFIGMNAFFNMLINRFFFAVPMLQPPMYHKNFAKYMNFGGIGVIMAHELSHGFDTMGVTINSKGVSENWFGNESLDAYKAKEECFVKKYSSYDRNGVHLDGEAVLREAIADNVGRKVAYLAYQKWLAENSTDVEDEILPKHNMTVQKMFFISRAQLNCITIREAEWPQQIAKEIHALGKFAIDGDISNSKEFAEAFECSSGSRMNPVEKCSIW